MPRDVNLTETLLALSLPREPARVEPRARAHQRRHALEHELASYNSLITSHLDEIFRRLDLVQNISNEQHTSTADTRVRLQAIERRARRLHQELQVAYEDNSGVHMPLSEREQLMAVRERQLRQQERITIQQERDRRQQERATRQAEDRHRVLSRLLTIGLNDDPYSRMRNADRGTTISPTFSTPDQSPETTNTSSESTADVHLSAPSPPEEPISANQYAAYLRWGQSRTSDDDLSRPMESTEIPTALTPAARGERDAPVPSRNTVLGESQAPVPPQRTYQSTNPTLEERTVDSHQLHTDFLGYRSGYTSPSTQPLIARTPIYHPQIPLGQLQTHVSSPATTNQLDLPVDGGPYISSLDPTRHDYWSRYRL
jgi:hypothetical protein